MKNHEKVALNQDISSHRELCRLSNKTLNLLCDISGLEPLHYFTKEQKAAGILIGAGISIRGLEYLNTFFRSK